MRLEDIDEDIMVQGYNYEPSSSEDSDDVDIEMDGANDEESESKKKITDFNFTPKTIGIIVGVIVVPLVVFTFWLFSKNAEDKRAAELLQQIEEESEEDAFKYTSEEIKELRLNGYTGDEIEKLEYDEVPAQREIEEAIKEREAKYEEEIKPLFDSASPEYKALLENTWLYGNDINYDISQVDTTWLNKNMTLNLDYTKVPAKGIQCFIRLVLKEKTDTADAIYMFMMIDPIRYATIPDSGNMVVYVEYYVTDQGTVVTKLEEKNVADK